MDSGWAFPAYSIHTVGVNYFNRLTRQKATIVPRCSRQHYDLMIIFGQCQSRTKTNMYHPMEYLSKMVINGSGSKVVANSIRNILNYKIAFIMCCFGKNYL